MARGLGFRLNPRRLNLGYYGKVLIQGPPGWPKGAPWIYSRQPIVPERVDFGARRDQKIHQQLVGKQVGGTHHKRSEGTKP